MLSWLKEGQTHFYFQKPNFLEAAEGVKDGICSLTELFKNKTRWKERNKKSNCQKNSSWILQKEMETETWTKTQTIKMAVPPEELKTKTETETWPHFKNADSTTIENCQSCCIHNFLWPEFSCAELQQFYLFNKFLFLLSQYPRKLTNCHVFYPCFVQ